MSARDNYQIGDDAPPVTGASDAREAERRRQMGGSVNPEELAADIAAGNLLSDTLAGLDYPAKKKDVLDFLYLRRERMPI